MRRSPRGGEGLEVSRGDPPVEMTCLGEPNLPDPFRVEDPQEVPRRPLSSRAGLYPEVTAAPYADPLYAPPAYGDGDDYVSPAAPKRPVYIADTPEELHGGKTPRPADRPRHAAYSSAAPWHTEQSTTIVVNQPQQPVVMSVRPGPVEMVHEADPVPTRCYNCDQHVITYIYYESGTCTWLACIGLTVGGAACGCCLIPFFITMCKDSIHKCPNCHVIIGKHRKIC